MRKSVMPVDFIVVTHDDGSIDVSLLNCMTT